MIIGVILIVIGLIIIIGAVTYKPYMDVDSWGDPSPDEACGWACLMCIVIFFGIFISTLGAMAMLNGV